MLLVTVNVFRPPHSGQFIRLLSPLDKCKSLTILYILFILYHFPLRQLDAFTMYFSSCQCTICTRIRIFHVWLYRLWVSMSCNRHYLCHTDTCFYHFSCACPA